MTKKMRKGERRSHGDEEEDHTERCIEKKGVELGTNDGATDADALHKSRRRSLYIYEYRLMSIVK